MHKLSKKEKIRKGGKLASLFNLKLDPKTKLYRLAPGLRERSAEEVFDLVHDVVLHVEYCEAVKEAVKALEGFVACADEAVKQGGDYRDDGSCMRNARKALAGFKKEGA
jgi:hypothetical protein